jgi:hypothetical protein
MKQLNNILHTAWSTISTITPCVFNREQSDYGKYIGWESVS